MKKILNFLGTITLIGTSTTSLIACDNITEYTEEKIAELKEENKISINGNTLEWMAPQENPFDVVDGKWYFVIWRGSKNDDWRIVKFEYDYLNKRFDEYNNYLLSTHKDEDRPNPFTLSISSLSSFLKIIRFWKEDIDHLYFKAVYRWEGKGEPKTPIIDPKTGEVTDWKEDKEVKKR